MATLNKTAFELTLGPGQERNRHLEIFFHKNWDKMLRYATAITRNKTTAEDLADETRKRMFLAKELRIDERSLLSYAYRAIANQQNDRHRHVKRHGNLVELDNIDFDLSEKVDYLELIADENWRRLFWQQVELLPDGNGKLFILHYREGLSSDEIAKLMGFKLGKVRSRLFKCRKKLFGLLHEIVAEQNPSLSIE